MFCLFILQSASSVPSIWFQLRNLIVAIAVIAATMWTRSIAAAWKALQERNVNLEDTEEGYAAQIGDSVSNLANPPSGGKMRRKSCVWWCLFPKVGDGCVALCRSWLTVTVMTMTLDIQRLINMITLVTLSPFIPRFSRNSPWERKTERQKDEERERERGRESAGKADLDDFFTPVMDLKVSFGRFYPIE